MTPRAGGPPRRMQKACLVCGRKKKRDGTKGGYKHRTSFYCLVPGCGGAGVCSPCHGRACFRAHLASRHGKWFDEAQYAKREYFCCNV
ncbi:hypothetical protein OAN61_00170 [bacterium]|nr:hypothetical protein [bacterium]